MAKELIFRLTRKDFVVEAKCGSGAGGQRKNRKKTACRITHPPSGAVAQSPDQREYKRNEQTAFRRLGETKKFKAWHSMETSRQLGHMKQAEERADELMDPKNLRVDVKDVNGRWVKEGS